MRLPTFTYAIALTTMLVGCGSNTRPASKAGLEPPAVPSPFPADVSAAPSEDGVIPDGVLTLEQKAKQPPPDPDVRWVRSEGPDLPAHLNPCRAELASDTDRVDGRQIVVTPTKEALATGRPLLWKSVRLTVYRDTPAATRAVAEIRTALSTCATHDEGGGMTTQWRSQPLDIGEESLFVGGQMYRATTALRGHYRGVIMRQGRAVMTYLDFGPLTEPAPVDETLEMQKDARLMATRLAGARWLRPG